MRKKTRLAAAKKVNASPENEDLKIPEERCLFDQQTTEVTCSARAIWKAIRGFYEEKGGYPATRFWRLRAQAEATVRRGIAKRELWRRVSTDSSRNFTVETTLAVPGRAWVRYKIQNAGKALRIQQQEIFEPAGLVGRAYWYATLPMHRLVFREMLREIAAVAERLD